MTNLHFYAFLQKLASSLKLVLLSKMGVINDAIAALYQLNIYLKVNLIESFQTI